MALLTCEGLPQVLSLHFPKALVETKKVSFFTFGGLVFKLNFRNKNKNLIPTNMIPGDMNDAARTIFYMKMTILYYQCYIF